MSQSTQKQVIAQNATIMMGSQIITWALGLVIVVALPRYLGPEAVGQLAVVGSIWIIAWSLASFSIENLLIKEIARDKTRLPNLLSMTIAIRAVAFIISAGTVALYVWLNGYDMEMVYLFLLIGLAQPIALTSAAMGASVQGLERMGVLSVSTILSKLIYGLLVLLIIFLNFGVYAVAAAGFISALLGLAVLFFGLARVSKLWAPFTMSEVFGLLKASIPFMIGGLLLIVYQQVDTITISKIADYETVGWYSSAHHLMGTFVFIPGIFIAAVFPALARSHSDGSGMLEKIASKSVDMMVLCSVPIGLGLVVVSDSLVVLLFGEEFAPSGAVLAMMGIALIAVYQTTVLGHFLIATDRLRFWLIVMVVGIIATIILDVLLVPLCEQWFANGAIGGALSYVVVESGMVLVGLRLMPKGTFGWQNLHLAMRVLVAGVVMVAITWWFRDLFIAIPIAVGACVYIGMIALLRAVSPDDIQLLTSMFQSKFGRIIRIFRPGSAAVKG